jgi:ppGpp synthetase/RelA/SpoT-type nucleotidyltranferase
LDEVGEATSDESELGPVSEVDEFDFEGHERDAVEKYRAVVARYADYAAVVGDVLRTALSNQQVFVHSVETRGKALESFATKARTPAENDPNRPKYDKPLEQITDLAGLRVITFILDDVAKVDELLTSEFEIVEKSDKGELLEEQLGYQSVHYLVRLRANRANLPEYVRFRSLTAEVQVRTILQHAWAEIEHDIQYKSVAALPTPIRRRFLALAGVLEIADREFQAINDTHLRIREEARASVAAGKLQEVEITADSLKAYLDRTLGPDGRMAEWSYGWMARLLLRMGFTTLEEVDACVDGYDADAISRALWGRRQGQLQRFEDLLFAAMGPTYIDRHPYTSDPTMSYWPYHRRIRLAALETAGIKVGSRSPETIREPL